MASKTDRVKSRWYLVLLLSSVTLLCARTTFGCSTSAWNTTHGAGLVSGQTNARFAGDCGLRLDLAGGTQGYLEDATPGTLTPAVDQYTARFYLYPGDAELDTSQINIFSVHDSSENQLMGIDLYIDNNQLTISAFAYDDNNFRFDHPGIQLNRGWRAIELQWQAADSPGADNGILSLLVDGEPDSNPVTGLDNDTHTVASARLGVVNGNNVSVSGLLDFDSFTSRRSGTAGIIEKAITGTDPVVENITFLGDTITSFSGHSITLGRRVTVDPGAVVNIESPVVTLGPGFAAQQGAQVVFSPY